MIRIDNIKLRLDSDTEDLKRKVQKILGKKPEEFYVYKKAVDARHKNDVHFVYSVAVKVQNEEKAALKIKNAKIFNDSLYEYPCLKKSMPQRPVIVGSGPAGTFAALSLAHAGARPIILERGKKVNERALDAELFFSGGALNEESNVQFGEGGAGTFSDGKLNTGTGSLYIRKILSEYVRFGAPERILWEAKPHIGTDILKKVAENIRSEIEALGGEYLFSDRLNSLLIKNGQVKAACANETIETDAVILAIGHSARDTFKALHSLGAAMAQKPFSVGMRIEHLQEEINKAQYGKFSGHKNLPPADYKFGDDCYTFCMCPGGYVVASSSENEAIVTNGMSYSDRGGINANSALLVNVDERDFGDGIFDGVNYQRKLEKAAYALSGSFFAPCQTFNDFEKGFATKHFGSVKPTYMPGVSPENIRSFMPERICDKIISGIKNIDLRLSGFASPDAVLTAPETRSSSPVRILRDPLTLESVNINGLYPCGEGAGYAGGIMSAASDGLRCAEKLIEKYNG